jgi:hypothetical protein
MSDDRELIYRICLLTAVLACGIAVAGWTLNGAGQAAGALVAAGITIANFLWLRWSAGLALRVTAGAGLLRRVLWVGASGIRFGVVALGLGLAVRQEWVSLGGLVAALVALPAALVAEGLRAARVS